MSGTAHTASKVAGFSVVVAVFGLLALADGTKRQESYPQTSTSGVTSVAGKSGSVVSTSCEPYPPPFADKIMRLETRHGNFGGSIWLRCRVTLVIYASTPPSRDVEELVGQASEHGFRVSWKHSYASSELARELNLLNKEFFFNASGLRNDASGLEVWTDDERILNARNPQRYLGSAYPVTVHKGRDGASPPL